MDIVRSTSKLHHCPCTESWLGKQTAYKKGKIYSSTVLSPSFCLTTIAFHSAEAKGLEVLDYKSKQKDSKEMFAKEEQPVRDTAIMAATSDLWNPHTPYTMPSIVLSL